MGYLAVAVGMTWTAWLPPGQRVIGGGEQPDWTGSAWAAWWTGHALSEGLNPFAGTWNFFPVGQAPVAQYNLLDAVLGAPFLHVLPPVLGYNLFALLVLASSALGAFVLARVAGASVPAAVVAGLAAASTWTPLSLDATNKLAVPVVAAVPAPALVPVVRVAAVEVAQWGSSSTTPLPPQQYPSLRPTETFKRAKK